MGELVTLRNRASENSIVFKKQCIKCKKIFPRDKDHFYSKPHRTSKSGIEYNAICITCDKNRALKWKRKNKNYRLRNTVF